MGVNFSNSKTIKKLVEILEDADAELIVKFGKHEALLSGDSLKEFLFNLRKHDLSECADYLNGIKSQLSDKKSKN